MNIRNMTLTDYNAVDTLMQQLHRLHVNGRPDLYIPMEHPYSYEEYRQKVEDEKYITILAEEDGEVIAICIVQIRERSMMINKKTAYMDDIYVSVSARRKGVATKIFREAEKLAKEKGAERLDLTVWEFNHEAMAFYRSLGMKEQRYILEKEL